jgi:hypothetical protein
MLWAKAAVRGGLRVNFFAFTPATPAFAKTEENP